MFRRPQRSSTPLTFAIGSCSVQNRLATTVPRFQREHLLAVAGQALEVGLAAGRLSEVSLRVTGNKMLITCRGAWFGSVGDGDLLLAAMQPNKTLDTPDLPRHVEWHRAIYAALPAVKVIVIVQPAALMKMALQTIRAYDDDGIETPQVMRPDDGAGFGDDFGGMAVVPNATAEAIAVAAAQAGVLLTTSGIISCGVEGYEAIAKLHSAERWAGIKIE
jgi:ribulose-5-phosphate 4-epimerase/fuculose-1-phosphate aldolase